MLWFCCGRCVRAFALAVAVLTLVSLVESAYWPGISLTPQRATKPTRTIDSCAGATAPCLPNYLWLGQGFDVTEGTITSVNLLNISLSVNTTAYAYGLGMTTLPSGVQLSTINLENTAQNVFESSFDYQAEYALSLGVSLPVPEIQGVLSLSGGFGGTFHLFSSSYLFNSHSYTKLVATTISPFDANTGAFILTPQFRNQVNLLPTVYNNSTKLAYLNFIENFGTHYIYYLAYGAEITLSSSVSSCSLQSQTVFDLAAGVQNELLNLSGQGGAQGSATAKEVYNSSTFDVQGGSAPCTQYKCDWDAVLASLNISNVVPVEMLVVGIETIIADYTISANVKQAVGDYLISNALPPLVPPTHCGQSSGDKAGDIAAIVLGTLVLPLIIAIIAIIAICCLVKKKRALLG